MTKYQKWKWEVKLFFQEDLPYIIKKMWKTLLKSLFQIGRGLKKVSSFVLSKDTRITWFGENIGKPST